MAITNGYTDLVTFKSWHTGITDAADDAKLEDVITAVSRWIDNYCQRHFWQATAATRTFSTGCWYQLNLGPFNDLVSVTSLKTDAAGDGTFETTWDAGDYQLLPPNPSAAPEARPYTAVEAIASKTFPVPSGTRRRDRVQIVGTFGWSAIPQAVEQACLIQSARVFSRRKSPEGVAGFGDFGVVRVGARLDPDVQQMLDPYRHPDVTVLVA